MTEMVFLINFALNKTIMTRVPKPKMKPITMWSHGQTGD